MTNRETPGSVAPLPPRLPAVLRQVGLDLEAFRVPWAVVGGLAVYAHTGSGATDDIDLAVGAESDDGAEILVSGLQERGYRAVTSVEHEASKRLASVLLEVKGEDDQVDPVQLLFASSGIEREIAQAAEPMTLFGARVPVAPKSYLLATKILSHDLARPQDGEDIAALLPTMNEEELQAAEDAFVIITDRGFNRGRNLAEEYERFLVRTPDAGAIERFVRE